MDKCKIADGFLSAMFGKAATILLRLTGILKALKTSVRFLEGFDVFQGSPKKETNSLEAVFVSWVESNISTIAKFKDTFVVDDVTVVEAARLLEYFNIHRLKLAGYAVTSKSLGIDTVLQLTKKNCSKYDSVSQKLMAKIMMSKEQVVIFYSYFINLISSKLVSNLFLRLYSNYYNHTVFV